MVGLVVVGLLGMIGGGLLLPMLVGIGIQSNNYAKTSTLLWGVKLAISLDIPHLHIQGDSKLIIDAVSNALVCRWRLKDIIVDIQILV